MFLTLLIGHFTQRMRCSTQLSEPDLTPNLTMISISNTSSPHSTLSVTSR